MAASKQTAIFTSSQLQEFLAESTTCEDLLDSLVHEERRRTETTLSRPGHAPDFVIQMVAVLLKATQSKDVPGVIDLLTVLVGSNFFMRDLVSTSSALASSIDEKMRLSLMENLVKILKQVSDRLPSSFTNAFGLIIILQKRTEEMLLTAEGEHRIAIVRLSDTLGEMRDSVMKRMITHSADNPRLPFEKQAPPDDFRKIPILPRVSDIFLGSRGAFLRKNKARGAYESLKHYLDVQFRLYREDCISPLREGITQYVQEVSAGHNVKRLQDGRLYKNVSIEYEKHNVVEGQQYTVTLDPAHAKRIKWKSSRRLLYGSLLCMSTDDFHTMVFAVVAESERDELMKNHSFKIIFPSEVGEVRLPLNAKFTMVESTAYFEAYRHVLVGLQRLEDGELPFEKYIVRCMTDVERPLYLKDDNITYNLEPIVFESFIFGYRSRKLLNVKVNDPVSHWPSAEQLHLDQSQFEAFHAALTQEFVLIQGPPGTGKTHVGLQIAKALLHNKDVWQDDRSISHKAKKQMLVVCYTNHALDQFMEGIVQFLDNETKDIWCDEIVRVGGRSENESMEEFSLKKRRYRVSRFGKQLQERKLHQMYISITRQHEQISFSAYSLCHLQDTILDVELLWPFMLEHHSEFFRYDDKLSPEKLYKWLEADKENLLRRTGNAYKKISYGVAKGSAFNEKTETPCQASAEYEDDEAKKVEDDRRIEDDDFGTQFQGHIGLDINKQTEDILFEISTNQQVDENFQLLLQREAKMILSELKSENRLHEQDVARIQGSLRKLQRGRRWNLYRYWVNLYKQYHNNHIGDLEQEYYESIKAYEKEKKEVDAEILRNSTVIGMTTTGAARYQDVLTEIGPRIVIVEEAAEVLEAHIVTALSPQCEHLILIGDHKQLEPKPSVIQLALKYNLSLSMFERMLNNGIKNHCLQRQHRMRPEISTLVRDIYDVLDDNENVHQYEHIRGVRKDVFFINHNQAENYADDIRSYSNKHEAQYIANLCRYLLKQGYKGSQITVLAAYTGQMFCIRDCMPRHEFEGVRTVAIDNFQGEENDIILLSIVRSNNEGKIGFLSRENRICVALSRAKKGLYVIGNFNMFKAGNRRWADVVQKVKLAGQFGKSLPLYCQNHPNAEGIQAEDASDFTKSPDGGCQLKCDFRLSCGHACRLHCHPVDKEHTKYVCRRPCAKTCENDHICQKICHFDRNCECPVVMTKVLPCGHSGVMKCFEPAQDFRCDTVVERELGCGHLVNLKCHVDPETYRCKVNVTRMLRTCSHDAEMACHENPEKYKCRVMVTRTLESCEHEAEMECCFDVHSYKCKVKVNRILSKCGHEADMKCYENPSKVMCGKLLTKTREKCGHSYDVICNRFDCYFERQHKCEETITKSWECSHTKVMKCYESGYASCEDKCLKLCEQHHECPRRCHYPSSCKCEVKVVKIIPTCGHEQEIPCYKDPVKESCRKMVMKRLKNCNHEKLMECSADPSSYRYRMLCDVLVSKAVSKCQHLQTMKCSESPSLFRCKLIVGKSHPRCGHTIQMECYHSPDRYSNCDTIVSKPLLCGHNMDIKCSTTFDAYWSIHDYQCNADINYTLPKCRHTVTIPCHLKTELENLEEERVMYKTPITILSRLPTCKVLVNKTFPCGHSTSVECHSAATKTCSSKCSTTMSCGHVCPRKCTECFDTLTHGECKESCGKRQICGHICSSTTCGSCKHCYKQCENLCPHRRCEHPCFRECIQCKQKCPIQCPHRICSRLCYEECDKPPCKQPCPKLLKCKHPCMGYCGDPCPNLCLVCDPTKWSELDDEWLSVGDVRIVRLEDCGHEHAATHLEESFEQGNSTLSLLCCPACKNVIRWHPRYNNRLKKQQQNVAAMKMIITMGSEEEYLYPTICGGVEEARSYLKRLNTFWFLQNKLNECQKFLEKTYTWGVSTTLRLTQFLDNLKFSADIRHQDRFCINQAFIKLSAIWLLHIAKGRKTDHLSSDSEEEIFDEPDDDGLEESENKVKANAVSNAALLDADTFIRNSETFGRNELEKVQETLGLHPSDQSEVKQVITFPSLQAIGIHIDDWVICPKGHIGSTFFNKKKCFQCETGIPLASTYETFWKKRRNDYEESQNRANIGRGSKRNKRGKRGGGRGGRGLGENDSETVGNNDVEQILPYEMVYMKSPHQKSFQQRGRGRGERAGTRGWLPPGRPNQTTRGRGGYSMGGLGREQWSSDDKQGDTQGGIGFVQGQNSRGRGGYRVGDFGTGRWDGNGISDDRRDGFGSRGGNGAMSHGMDASDERMRSGKGNARDGAGRNTTRMTNRSSGFWESATSPTGAEGYGGENARVRGGRWGELDGRPDQGQRDREQGNRRRFGRRGQSPCDYELQFQFTGGFGRGRVRDRNK